MDRTWKFLGSGILIHTLELKLRYFEVSSYACIGKPCICNVFCPRVMCGAGLRAHINGLPNLVKIEVRLSACILYGSTMHPAHLCGDFWTFFSA